MNVGYLIAFAAMSCYALLPPMAKALTSSGLTGAHLILINSVMLAGLSIVYLLVSQQSFSSVQNVTPALWGLACVWAVVNFTGFVLYLSAIEKIPATEYQIMYLASPIIVAVVSYFFLNEMLQWKHLIGGILVEIGVYIVVKP